MHQPDYRHPDSGQFVLPWVLLHAIKDYSQTWPAHLESAIPGMQMHGQFRPGAARPDRGLLQNNLKPENGVIRYCASPAHGRTQMRCLPPDR
jgi:hypothetical protein